jgi:hypothetical protein
VIPPNQPDGRGISDFQSKKKTKDFNGFGPTIHVIPEKEPLHLRRGTGQGKAATKVGKLAVNVATNVDRAGKPKKSGLRERHRGNSRT